MAVWTRIGHLSGSHINTIYDTATRYSAYLALAAGALVLAYIAGRLIRRTTRAAGERE